jgi:hypothetical protein
MSEETPQDFVRRYCPTFNYTVKKKHVDALRQTFGRTTTYNGLRYRIKTESLGAGWYYVTASLEPA